MIPRAESHDLLGCTLIVIATLAITEGRPDPSPTVVAAVSVVTLACFGYLWRRLHLR